MGRLFFALARSVPGLFYMHRPITPYASTWRALIHPAVLVPDGTKKARIWHAVKPGSLALAEKSPKYFTLLKR
jgi:hypothetical protein